MSDTVTANAGSGGPVFATDDNAGVHYPYTKLVWGPDNTFNLVDVASGKSLPVQLRTAAGVEIPLPAALAANGGFKVEGVASGVAVNVVVASIAAGTTNIGDVDVLTVPADPFGVNADAASVSTSISAKLKGIVTALGITALDLGSGTGGSRTLRWFHDTAQWIGGAGAVTAATMRATLASDDPAVAALGVISGAKVVTDANGTLQQYLRGVITFLANVIGAGLATSAFRVVSTIEYAASSALTITIASLATSATWVAGRASTAFDNTTLKYPAVAVAGFITTGTTPTVGEIQVWLVPILDDTVWPDSVTGTDAAKTFTTAPILASCGVLIGRMVNTTTSNVAYPFRAVNIVSLLGFMPKKFVIFVTHSTVAALHATGGNHSITVTPIYQ